MVVGAWAVVGGTAAILAPAAGAWAVLPVVGACALLPWLTGRMLAAAALVFVGACATVNDRAVSQANHYIFACVGRR